MYNRFNVKTTVSSGSVVAERDGVGSQRARPISAPGDSVGGGTAVVQAATRRQQVAAQADRNLARLTGSAAPAAAASSAPAGMMLATRYFLEPSARRVPDAAHEQMPTCQRQSQISLSRCCIEH